MDIIVGLDISTVCIGLTLAKEEDGKIDILQVTHFRLKTPSKVKGVEGLFRKSGYFNDVLKTYVDLSRFGTSETVTKVVIEEPLIGSNNSETICTLMRFNGMISQNVYNTLGVMPEFISSYDARKYAFPELMAVRKYNKNGKTYDIKKFRRALRKNELVLFGGYEWDCSKKEILWNKVSEMFPNIHWVYNKNGELAKENFDASDSLVCVIGYVRKRLYDGMGDAFIKEYSETETDDGYIIRYTTNFCGAEYEKKLLVDKEKQENTCKR